jgi:hypothetical protein
MANSDVRGPVSVPWTYENVTVSHVPRALPGGSDVSDRAKVVSAGLAGPAVSLPEDAWHALARASVQPAAVAVQLRGSGASATNLLMQEHVDGATLQSVHSRLWLTELFPGIQPRTAQEELGTDDPQVSGLIDEGRPQAIVRYRYRDPQHLRDHVWQTLWATLERNSYEESILARGITRALIAHAVVFEFDDGSEPVTALVARDGITRLASAWKVLAGPKKTAAEVADFAVGVLLDQAPQPPAEPVKPLTQLMALKREMYRKKLLEEFDRGWSDGLPSPRAVQIAQTYSVPAHVAVAVQADHVGQLSAEDVFDDAVRSILASVHVEFKPWDEAAQNVEVATRALKALVQHPDLGVEFDDRLQDIYALAVGRLAAQATPEVYCNVSIPGTELWRAVYLVHTFSRSHIYDLLRDRAKEIKGERRMTTKGYAGLLGPVVDLHWRASKKHATRQARNAWTNGGVLCGDVFDDWQPVPTDDFTSLVGPALDGDLDARCTLAVAGGVALIADKLITRNVGSALARTPAPGKVPFRADASVIVGGLARQDNELGLWTLALAAQRFKPDSAARDESLRQDLGLPEEPARRSTAYQYPAVDLDAPDRIRRTDAGEVALTQWDVVWNSDPDRARRTIVPQQVSFTAADSEPVDSPQGEAGSSSASATAATPQPATPPTRPVLQQLIDERRELTQILERAAESLTRLRGLGEQLSERRLLGNAEEWKSFREASITVNHAVEACNPDKLEDDEDKDKDTDWTEDEDA